jgi:hypothetical protein
MAPALRRRIVKTVSHPSSTDPGPVVVIAVLIAVVAPTILRDAVTTVYLPRAVDARASRDEARSVLPVNDAPPSGAWFGSALGPASEWAESASPMVHGDADIGRGMSPEQNAKPTRTPHPAIELPLDDRLSRCRVTEVAIHEPDTGIHSWAIRTYDGRGLPLREIIDTDGSGLPDGLRRWYYDEVGNVERVTWDQSMDGIIDWERTFEYLDDRQIEQFDDDSNGDGTVDRVVTFVHDSAGLIVERTSLSLPSGSIKYSFTYEYDAQKRLTVESYIDDTGGSPTISRYHWDDTLLVQMDVDFENDGAVDYTEKYAYDVRGLRTKLIDELDVNGEPAKWHTYRYDEMGLLIRGEDVERDVGVVGWLDQSYDPVGRPLRRLSAHLGLPSTEWTFRNECPQGSISYMPLLAR